MIPSMKLFVTGGTGFVGSNFLNAAHNSNHEIIALRRPGGFPRVTIVKEPNWVDGTLNGDYRKYLSGCDVFVHFACHAPNPPYDSLPTCLYWNVQLSLALAEQAREVGVQKYLIAGSCAEYGRSLERYEAVPVDAPLEPTFSYPTSKAAASVAFMGFAAEHQLQLQIYRIFQVYGNGEPSNRLWPSLMKAARSGADFPMTLGEQVRDFMDVKDLAEGFVTGLEFKNVVAGRPIVRNIGSGHPQTVLNFVRYWWQYWHAPGQLKPGALPYRSNEIMRIVPKLP